MERGAHGERCWMLMERGAHGEGCSWRGVTVLWEEQSFRCGFWCSNVIGGGIETEKNRYSNIVLFDEGAVILETTKHDKPDETYIHATKIKCKFGNYVLAQSPKPETLNDWYRMIWQLKIAVIVCLIPLPAKDDCAKYFERQIGKKLKHKRFVIRTVTSRKEGSCNVYELKFSNKDAKEEDRVIHLINFTKWKVIVRPPETRQILEMMRSVWATEASAKLADDKVTPTLVHGITGTRRTGTYVILSMLCRQIKYHRQMSLLSACSRVRHLRYSVMRNRICFTVLIESALTFAADQGLVNSASDSFKDAIKVKRACHEFKAHVKSSKRVHKFKLKAHAISSRFTS
ncbi:unnamed protein product [Toxocara canis]|uniref:Tyrosine-protein phosphatase domain-containing protein n=1 Tax=Toxocara canis TaxID=6265 RepID=A0A183UHK5_TOXCA|nr:unnamed protein product [Toxocara canis]